MAKNTSLPGVGKISQLSLAGEHFSFDEQDIRYKDPVRACELCGEERASSDMINLICVIGSPGHYTLEPFQHPEVEHWACSIEHWKELSHRVVDEMVEHLGQRHDLQPDSVHHRNPS